MGEMPASPDARLTREQVRALALAAGFTEAGLVALPYADEERDALRFTDWVRAGRAGTMRYLERKTENGQLTAGAGARSVSVGALGAGLLCQLPIRRTALNRNARARGAGWIARYAWSSRILPSR